MQYYRGIDMTQELYNFVENMFYNVFCKAQKDDFIIRTWDLYRRSSDPFVDEVLSKAIEADLATSDSRFDVEDLISDFAGDVIHNLWEDNMLPCYYADLYEIDVYGEPE